MKNPLKSVLQGMFSDAENPFPAPDGRRKSSLPTVATLVNPVSGKRKNGRPQASVDEKKICAVTVKFSSNDYGKIFEKAKNARVSVAAFVRSSALNSTVVARPSAEEMEEIRNYTNLRNSIGNNLNQLAKWANTCGYGNAVHNELKKILLTTEKK